MAKIYKQNIRAILTTLGIAEPDNITMDQVQLEGLIAKVKTKLDTYDPLPTGNALVTDVLAGKTFSNATGTGKTGTLTLAMLTADADAVATDLLVGKTAYVNGVKLDGALAYTALPAPNVDVLGGANQLLFMEAPMYASYFDSIQVLDAEGAVLGVATPDGGGGTYMYDIADLVLTGGDIVLGAKYLAKDTVTLSDSAVVTVEFSTVDVTRTLTGCVDSNTISRLIEETSISGTLSLLESFTVLPVSITVDAGVTPLTVEVDFTYDNTTGAYTINAAAVTDDITITAIASA